MARIRSIKPEFWKSEAIARLPRPVRLTFIALWSYVDDNGVGRDNEKLIVAELYPLEDDPTEALGWVREDLATLARESRVTRYTVDGKPYIHVTGWVEHQKIDRPNKPRYPLPSLADRPPLTCDDHAPSPASDGVARDPRETPSPGAVDQGTGEQGNEGAEEAAVPPQSAAADLPRQDVEGLCGYFAAALARNDVHATITSKWRTEARLMLDKDQRRPDDIRAVIDWATTHGFWRANILSVPTLRAKFDQLRLAMEDRGGRRPVGSGIASLPDVAYEEPGIFTTRSLTRDAS